MQSNLARCSSRREQKNRESHYSHHSWKQRRESEGNSYTASITACQWRLLCAKSKKLVNEKKLFVLLHQPKNSYTQWRMLHTFNSFLSQIFSDLHLYFFSAELLRFCPRFLTQANEHLTRWVYSLLNVFSITFLDWGNSPNGISKKVVSYFLSKIFQKTFCKPWQRKEIADGDIFHSWLTTM